MIQVTADLAFQGYSPSCKSSLMCPPRSFPNKLLGLSLAAIFLSALLGFPAAGQPLSERPFFAHLDLPDEFLPDQELAITQDEDGYLWFGTLGGLFRYDGYNMLPIERSSSTAKTEVDCGRVQDVLAAGRHLWLGTRCGLERRSLDTEVVERWQLTPSAEPQPIVTHLQLDPKNRLWVGTNAGLFWLDSNDVWQDLVERPLLPEALRSGPIHAFFLDPDGPLWVGTAAGLFRFDPEHRTFLEIPFGEPTSSPEHRKIHTIHRDGAGNLWATTADGLRRLEDGADLPGRMVLEQALPQGCNKAVRQWNFGMTTDSRGNLWVSVGGNLVSWLPGSERVGCYSRYSKDPRGLGGSAGRLFTDRAGALWVATEKTLDRHIPKTFSAWEYTLDKSVADLGWQTAWSTDPLLDLEGDLWIGSNLGLFEIDLGSHQLLRHFMADDPELLELVRRPTVGNLPGFTVLALAEQPDGTLWAGTATGLGKLAPGASRFETIEFETGWDDPPRITRLLIDGEKLWVGTSQALHRLTLRDQVWTRVSLPPVLGPPGTPFQVKRLAVDATGRLWVGTADRGLLTVAPGAKGLSLPQLSPERTQQNRPRNVTALHFEAPNHLWLAFETDGVHRVDLASRTAQRPQWAAEFTGRVITGIRPTGQETWLLTRRGLSKVDATGRTWHFDADDGLVEPQTVHGFLPFEDGRLLVTGSSLFELARPASNAQIPPVRLTDLRLFNERVRPRRVDPDSPLDGSLLGAERLELQHHQSVVTFEFSALGAAHPSDLKYFYHLEGIDPSWLETRSAQPFATYTHLKPGSYQLRVRAGASGSSPPGDPATEATLELLVRSPWWNSPWAWLAYALAAVGLFLTYAAAQRRKLQREQRLNTELRRLDEMKDAFLANTSHELRTPLFGITGLAESLLEGSHGPVPGAMRQNLDLIVSSGRRLATLVNDILDFSSLRRQGIALSLRPLDLRSLVNVVLTLQHPSATGQKVTLRNAVPEGLTAVRADEARAQQILHSLVGNAIKFASEGEVEVHAREEGDLLRIEVRDNGIGISSEHQNTIFNMFEQVDGTPTRGYGGTGLGLALTRQLVELHGGELGVHSAPGQGATFYFTLPMAKGQPEEPSYELKTELMAELKDLAPGPTLGLTHARADTPGTIDTSKKGPEETLFEILIVDDEPINLLVLEGYLSGRGYRLTTAADGPQALEQLAERNFDLILLDVMMPRMSGFEVCRIIREQHSIETLPILFLTARTKIADRVAGFELGANDYLIKPVAKDELLARVEKELAVLTRNRAAQEELGELRRLIPICSSCHKIRDDRGLWEQLENYLERHAHLNFTHSLCSGCVEEFMEEMASNRRSS